MEIIKDIKILDLCLYLKKYKTLVIADLHLGFEESLNKKGILVPRIQFKDIYEKLDKILSLNDIETVIITGDFKHEFGVIHNSEWKNITKIIDLILKKCKDLIVLKGNHDITLPYIVKRKGIEILDHYKIDDITICHGDKIVDCRRNKIIIIGHEHPAIGLTEGNKYEVYKCFLKCKWKDKILIVLPAFHSLTVGTDVLRKKLLSPFLNKNLSKFEAYVVENNKVYKFDKLRKF